MRAWYNFSLRQKQRYVPIPPDAYRRMLPESKGVRPSPPGCIQAYAARIKRCEALLPRPPGTYTLTSFVHTYAHVHAHACSHTCCPHPGIYLHFGINTVIIFIIVYYYFTIIVIIRDPMPPSHRSCSSSTIKYIINTIISTVLRNCIAAPLF